MIDRRSWSWPRAQASSASPSFITAQVGTHRMAISLISREARLRGALGVEAEELDAAIAAVHRIGDKRLALALAHGHQAAAIDAMIGEVVDDGLGAVAGEDDVVIGAADGIGVALDGQRQCRLLAQQLGDAVELPEMRRRD